MLLRVDTAEGKTADAPNADHLHLTDVFLMEKVIIELIFELLSYIQATFQLCEPTFQYLKFSYILTYFILRGKILAISSVDDKIEHNLYFAVNALS